MACFLAASLFFDGAYAAAACSAEEQSSKVGEVAHETNQDSLCLVASMQGENHKHQISRMT